jgi:hypothetical protein
MGGCNDTPPHRSVAAQSKSHYSPAAGPWLAAMLLREACGGRKGWEIHLFLNSWRGLALHSLDASHVNPGLDPVDLSNRCCSFLLGYLYSVRSNLYVYCS